MSMYLPPAALTCIQTLEQAGHKAYAVGGCVRDSLLGRTPHDYDLCSDATPDRLCEIFSGYSLVRSGEKHGTIGVVIEKQVIEITTFRTEGGYRDSRHPDWVRFVTDVEADLARRDFTVNAMAYSPKEGYIDPWGGQQDLRDGVLRAVGTAAERFTEDPLRILRGVRFAVRFGLQAEQQTRQAMDDLAPLMENLARERVFDELCKLISVLTAEDLLRYRVILTQALPELGPCVDFAQHNRHHIYDVYTHTARVVAAVPDALALRWAALLHDIGKPDCFQMGQDGQGHFYGHAQLSAEMADRALRRLKSPTALREQVCLLIESHMRPLEPDRKLLRRRVSRYGMETVRQMLQLQEADTLGTGTRTETDMAQFRQIEQLLQELAAENACLQLRDLTVKGKDLMALGFPAGPKLGACLKYLLEQVVDEQLANDREALLAAAQQWFTDHG